jgi:hypothetical protein
MKQSRRWKVGLVLAFAASLSVPASAFLGIGDIVFDPSVYEQAVRQLIQMEQQYAQLVRNYQMLQSQYEQLKWMAQRVPVNMAARYRALASPWRSLTAGDRYGTTAAWTSGLNTGQGVGRGYSQATETLGAYGGAVSNIPADQVERIKASYGTVELTDGANVNGMETLGRLRANALGTESTIQRLEDDSLSSDPAMNTEVAVLNKINAANLLSLRTGRDTNQLLVALTEQQILTAKRTRDAEARAINQHIRFMKDGKAVMTAQAAGASQAMLDWRMP